MRNITANLLRQLRGLDAGGPLADASDAELVRGFAARADEAAFEALLRRHGPMVLHVCRRVLRNVQDAEDAFQATFLVLARKAGALRHPEAVGNWLYGVAYRVALHARAAAARRAAHESRPGPEYTTDPLAEISLREAQQMLDAELSRLPEKYRTPLVLCCLEGMTRDEAARQLGWSPRTLKSRLERGRQLLRTRLTRRGVTLPAALAAVLLGESVAPAGVPTALARATLRAVLDSLGKTVAGATAATPAALALSEEMIRALAATRLKATAAMLLVVGLLTAGAGLAARRMAVLEPPGPEPTPVTETSVPADGADDQPGRADLFGDPLPREALVRFGTVRLRHAGDCKSLRFTPDGRTLVTQGSDGVRTWDAATGRPLHHFMPPHLSSLGAPTSPVGRWPVLSPDGRWLVLSGAPGITIWDIATAQVVRTLAKGSFGEAQFSPDGRVLAALGPDSANQLELWDTATGRRLHRLTTQGSMTAVVFAQGGKTLVTVQQDGAAKEQTLVFWDVATGAEQRRLGTGRPPLSRWTVSPNGTLLAAIRVLGLEREGWSFALWDITNGRELASWIVTRRSTLPWDWTSSRALAFTPDGKTLYAGGIDGELIGWDPRTGKEVQRVGAGIATANALAFAPDGKTVAVAEYGIIHLIDLDSGRERFPMVGHTFGAGQGAITADGRTVITANARLMVLWDARTGRQRHRIPGPEDCHTVFQLGPDGRTLVTCELSRRTGKVQAVRLWDPATGKQTRVITFAPEAAQITGLLAVSPDGRTLALRRRNGDIALWDAPTGRELRTLPADGAGFSSATFSLDGRTLLAVDRNDVIQFWNVAEGRKERTFPIPNDAGAVPRRGARRAADSRRGYSAQFSSDGRIVAVATSQYSQHKAIELYQLPSGRLLRKVDTLPGPIHFFALSPDSRTLAWDGSPEGSVRLVEVATGRERHQLNGSKKAVRPLAFSPDGKQLLCSYTDTTAILWDLTGRLGSRGAWDRPLSARELDICWAELAGADAVRAYQAIRRLAESPAEAVPYLAARLTPAPITDEGRRLRMLRALEVLEHAGTVEAGRVLDRLAHGSADAQLVREARAARQRLARLPAVEP